MQVDHRVAVVEVVAVRKMLNSMASPFGWWLLVLG
jgi:hypothetical protein